MNRIRELREKRDIEQKALAVDLCVSQPTISAWETGAKQPSSKSAAKIADYFDVSIDYLLGRSDVRKNTQRHKKPFLRIPVLGTVPAGIPVEAMEDIEDWEELGEEYMDGREYIGLKIHGTSMEPEYRNGDVLIVRIQNTADTGDDAVVFVNGDDATFKRISRNKDGLILRPLNPEYEPLHFSNEEIVELPIRVFGVAVEFRRTIRR